ncbi:hypothetical protein INP57_10935 [Saccharopolyspora sp. HNM0986]|uniref:hypothetical protein n=1 Tax=Saccharopolyspora galaxeae TaxID=2781241 RepID=UPI00190C7C14|nr:hypothetical protein [Saccharopolyspora sp. HNM0986]MBK0867324.1 hypothetical protein [Saccharopolyspora sp. HNM0986]
MTAPTRAKTAASRTGTAGKKNTTEKGKSQQSGADKTATQKTATQKTATQKTATRRNSATKSKQDTKARGRSAAAERAYNRREERRERSAREAPERRPRGQRPAVEQRQPRLLRLSAVRPAARQLQAKVATSRAPLVVVVMGVLGVGLVTSLSLSIATVGGSYRLQRSGAELTALNEQRELLLREVSNMDSTPALQRKAAELGMVPPDSPPAHLLVQPDGGVRTIGDPQAATAPEPATPPPPPPVSPPSIPQPPAPQSPAPQPPPDGQQVPDPQRQAVPIPAVEGR